MLFLSISLSVIDNACEGDGFKLSWINCQPSVLNQFANTAAGILYINAFLVLLLAPALTILTVVEYVRWKSRISVE